MDSTQQLRDYLKTWLERHQQASQVAPAVREALDQAEWELGVLRDRPSEALNIPTSRIEDEAGLALRRITKVLPQMPDYTAPVSSQVNSISISSTTAAFTYVHAVAQIGTRAAVQYSAAKTQEYRLLQEKHQRRLRVRSLIQELVPGLLARFDAACGAVDQHRVGVGAKSAAASELRNLVDGIQGDLFEKARRTPKEKMTWPAMAGTLFPNSPTSVEVMLSEEPKRAVLYRDLSNATKDREGQKEQSIEDLTSRALDHLFVVLSLLKSDHAV